MKKLDTTVRIELKMPCLYREDLEEIESTIIGASNQTELKIRTDKFEYDRVSEIAPKDQPAKQVRISSSKPFIQLSFSKTSAEIYGSGEDAVRVTGVIKPLADIIRKRERKINWINSRIGPFYSLILTLAFLNAFGPIKTKWFDQLTRQQLIIVLISMLILMAVGFRDSFFSYSLVSFDLRSKKTNWLARNKDQILLGLVNTIISGVVGYFIGTSK